MTWKHLPDNDCERLQGGIMSYEIEAAITCDRCGAGIAYTRSKDDDWRAALDWLDEPSAQAGGGQSIPCKSGDKHLCEQCKGATSE